MCDFLSPWPLMDIDIIKQTYENYESKTGCNSRLYCLPAIGIELLIMLHFPIAPKICKIAVGLCIIRWMHEDTTSKHTIGGPITKCLYTLWVVP